MITGKNQIGNRLSANGKRTFKTFDPQNNTENKYVFFEASEVEVEEALLKADEAFQEYSLMSDQKRADFLIAVSEELATVQDAIYDIYIKESGLSLARAKVEMKRTLFQLESFAEYILSGNWRRVSIDHAIPDRIPSPKPELRKTNIPLGPVVVFGSSNFPLAYSTAGGDTASALAAGCPVIVKGHPMHAGTGELVAAAINRAAKRTGMPDGVFSNLNSVGYELGTMLVSDSRVKAVGFTGSLSGGRALFDLANKRPVPIPVFAEMGSTNPVLISAESIKNRSGEIAKLYADSITQGTGQFCTNPGLLFAMDCDELSNFTNALAKEINTIQATAMLHPQIKEKFMAGRTNAMDVSGVSVLTEETEVAVNYGEKTLLMVDGKTFLENPELHHEVFGPLSIIVKCTDHEELNRIVSQINGQLTGTVILENNELDKYRKTIHLLRQKVGRIIFNGVPTGVEVCPSMTHGGPYPATTDSRFTAVGVNSIYRWLRPITYQNFPKELLPPELSE